MVSRWADQFIQIEFSMNLNEPKSYIKYRAQRDWNDARSALSRFPKALNAFY